MQYERRAVPVPDQLLLKLSQRTLTPRATASKIVGRLLHTKNARELELIAGNDELLTVELLSLGIQSELDGRVCTCDWAKVHQTGAGAGAATPTSGSTEAGGPPPPPPPPMRHAF